MGKLTVNPDILRWARVTSNLSLDDVGRALNKTPEDVGAWESGLERPTYGQLEILAYRLYKRPLAVFFFPGPPDIEDARTQFRTFPDDEYTKLSRTLVFLIREAQSIQMNLEELCEGESPAKRSVLNEVGAVGSTDVAANAQRTREVLGISLGIQIAWKDPEVAFDNWRKVLEDSGIFVFRAAFRDSRVSGFCLYDSQFPLVYVNNSMPPTRRVFTLFHELSHLLHRVAGIDSLDDWYINDLQEQSKSIEVFCNRFAGAFLVPDYDFDWHVRRAKDPHADVGVQRLADRYSVSREVILRKLLDRGMVSQDYYESKVNEWAGQVGKRRSDRGNWYRNRIQYLGRTYLDLAFGGYYTNRITQYQLSEYLGVKVSNLGTLEAMLAGATRP